MQEFLGDLSPPPPPGIVLPKCCTLSWWGGLRALMTLEAISAGTAVPGRFNLAGQVPGERPDELQHLALQVGGLGEGPITLPCQLNHITETARPYAQQGAKRIGEVGDIDKTANEGLSLNPSNQKRGL